MCVFVSVSGCLCIGGPTARLFKRLGAVNTNKGVLTVWSRDTVLRLATVLIFNKHQSGLNLVLNLLLFLCKLADFYYGILITKVSFKIRYKLLNTLLAL